MTVKEFGLLADAIKTYFPKENMFPTKKSVNLWYEELKDLEYKMASAELRKYIALNRFPPTISDIRECLIDFSEEKYAGGPEAWESVMEVLMETDEGGMATKRFEALPDIIKKAIGGRECFMELVENVAERNISRSSFIRSYERLMEDDVRKRKLQPEIRKMIEMGVGTLFPDNGNEFITESSKK